MTFETEAFDQLATLLSGGVSSAGFAVKRSVPATISNGDGPKLKLFTSNGQVVDRGYVLTSPNVPRPFHTNFDSDDPKRTLFGGDWFDKIIYVSTDDYEKYPIAIDILSLFLATMRPGLDHVDASGCSFSAPATKLFRLNVGASGGMLLGPAEGPYTVLTGKFLGDTDMVVSEYWIAKPEDRDQLTTTQAWADAMARSKASVPPADLAKKQKVVCDHVKRLRGAFKPDPYDY